jgi:DNA-binding NtrC family response regulator
VRHQDGAVVTADERTAVCMLKTSAVQNPGLKRLRERGVERDGNAARDLGPSRAAEILGLPATTLRNRMKNHGVSIDRHTRKTGSS